MMSKNSEIRDLNYYIDWLNHSIVEQHIKYYEYSDFKNIQQIGKGSYGNVERVNWKNRFFALKSFNQDYQIKKYSLVLEYANGGTLNAYLKEHFNDLDWSDKSQLALQLASAVEHIHSKYDFVNNKSLSRSFRSFM